LSSSPITGFIKAVKDIPGFSGTLAIGLEDDDVTCEIGVGKNYRPLFMYCPRKMGKSIYHLMMIYSKHLLFKFGPGKNALLATQRIMKRFVKFF